MKKDYEFWVSKRNTPNLKLYTLLIGLSYGALAINIFIAFLYGKFKLNLEPNVCFYIMLSCAVTIILTLVAIIDPRKENRNFFTAVLCVLLHGICTVFIIALMKFWHMIIIYSIEIVIEVAFICAYHKSKSGN